MGEKLIHKIPLINKDGTVNIFNSKDIYIIPLYQRVFAWEKKQVEQLIDDIENFSEDNYYLGNLIVEKNNNSYEVIDGQQRLTALFLLLSALNKKLPDNCLTFEHREKSIKTLKLINKGIQNYKTDEIDEGMYTALKNIKSKLKGLNIQENKFYEKLKKVLIIRVNVPPFTDLNKYFEIMNNRGEQLEQQDILKADLISYLPQEKRAAFASIWNACSNMDDYVQKHLTSKKGFDERTYYFGEKWKERPKKRYLYNSRKYENTDNIGKLSINKLAEQANINSDYENTGIKQIETKIRFESFIEFRHLLLHTLKVYKDANGIKDDSQKLIDDKKLLKTFKEYLKKLSKNEKPEFSEEFIICLLKCRYFLDNFMLKRDYNKDDIPEGEWSIKYLLRSNYGEKNSEYYNNLHKDNEIIMLQSMLRVTYTSPLSMHWVTEYFKWLYNNDYSEAEAKKQLISYAKEEVDKFIKENDFNLGLKTPHIVFNYLDFLLWKQKSKPKKFKFEFRNSVEHWYPQNPTDGNPKWPEKILDNFGNLCIVSSGINSKFSNNMPTAKKGNFNEEIGKQSLKLQEMARKTKDNSPWNQKDAKKHGEEMIDILKN